MSNFINTDNHNGKNIITVTNTNIKTSEKSAERYADAARRDMQECASYLAAIQGIHSECQRVRDSINITLGNDLTEHINDSDNPHMVSAEQLDVYTKTESDELLSAKSNLSDLASVATSGDYDDLINKPNIPAAQIQSDWNQSDNTAMDYIKNKPAIPAAQVNSDWSASSGIAQILNKPSIPSKTSDLTNDSGFITAGSLPTVDSAMSTTSTNPVQNAVITNAVNSKSTVTFVDWSVA